MESERDGYVYVRMIEWFEKIIFHSVVCLLPISLVFAAYFEAYLIL